MHTHLPMDGYVLNVCDDIIYMRNLLGWLRLGWLNIHYIDFKTQPVAKVNNDVLTAPQALIYIYIYK